MRDLYFYIFIGYLGVFLTAIAQLTLKFATIKYNNKGRMKFFINPFTLIGYTILLLVTLLNLYIFQFLDLKYVFMFLPTTYILIPILSYFFLKEKISRRQLVQYALIFFGIIVFNL